MENIVYAPANELAQAIRKRTVSCSEVINEYFAQIEKVNPKLNAVVQINKKMALHDAQIADLDLARGNIHGPLHGVPFTIKDTFQSKGLITAAGTEGLSGNVPKTDATVLERLRKAGGILIGKTNTPELAFACETENMVYGRTNNPYDILRSPGGSSGGEAAIIASCGSAIGIGSDAGGSIRDPAHFCGIAGIKPTFGRVPMTGHIPPVDGIVCQLWHVGIMSRYVEDLIMTLPIIAGQDGIDPTVVPVPLKNPDDIILSGLRGAYFIDNGLPTPTKETVVFINNVIKDLRIAGVRIEENKPKNIEMAYEMWFDLYTSDSGEGIKKLLTKYQTKEIHPFLKNYLKEMKNIHNKTTAEFYELLEEMDRWRREMLAYFGKYDFLICPAVAFPAMPHGFSSDPKYKRLSSYSMPFNITGWPSLVVRCGETLEGLPIGIQIVGHSWREDLILKIGKYIEKISGGWKYPTGLLESK